jgi:DNA-binding response OmpR family regulator
MLGHALGAEEAGSLTANAAQPALRLLVVDDDNLHCTIVCRVAAKMGYAPVAAASYEEAMKLTQENAFDCIALDLSLGEHVGVELLHQLAALGCKAPIIIVSGCDEATWRETLRVARSLDLDVLERVRKPVDLAILRYALERLRNQRINALGGA